MTRHQQIIDYFQANYNLTVDDNDVEDMFGVIDRYRGEVLPWLKLEKIIQLVSQETGVSRYWMIKNRRKTPEVFARHLVFFLARRHTSKTFNEIGVLFKRDHTTIIHGVSKIKDIITTQYPIECYNTIVKMQTKILNKPAPQPSELQTGNHNVSGKL